jgi:hypothetical protein
VNAVDFLELAKFLERRPKGPLEEAALRGSCGRAYYAAFAFAGEVLRAASFAIPANGTAHGKVISLLKRSLDPDVQSAGSNLDQLRETRNSADYDTGSVPVRAGPFIPLTAQLAIARSSVIIDTMGKRLSKDPRVGIPPGVT